MYSGKKIGVIIPAAGKGKRIGGKKSKQFLELDGKPVLLHTIGRFEGMEEVDAVVLAVDPGSLRKTKDLITKHGLKKISAVVEGGPERQDSVWNCLRAIKNQNIDIIMVHDAVRPFVSGALILSVLAACVRDPAVIPCVRPKDTIKESDDGIFIGRTPDRENLWAAQTPQAFDFRLLYGAFEKAYRENIRCTDEAGLLERLGYRVRIISGSYDNIKITTPEDLQLAVLISKRMSGKKREC